jgi:hypothetical protein
MALTGDFFVPQILTIISAPPPRDEPTLPKTVQCTVLVGEMSLQQQMLQAVPENGVALAPFETAVSARALTEGFFHVRPNRTSAQSA